MITSYNYQWILMRFSDYKFYNDYILYIVKYDYVLVKFIKRIFFVCRLLPYSIVAPDDEIALFVCDLERGRRKDYEPTIEYYRNLLDKHGCTRVNEIIPINRMKTEFDQFELKKKLLSSYDHFLVDGRIAGHISHLLGKLFSKRRKLPTSVRMESKDLKHEIDYALRKANMQLHSYGDTHLMQIGNTSMNKKKILL